MRRRVGGLAHPQGLGRLGLALVHRDDAGPDDLGHVGPLVQAEPEGSGDERGDEGVGVDRVEGRPERDPERELRVQIGDADVPEGELDQDRRAPEEPDVDPRRTGQQAVGREPHHGQDHAEHDADHHGDDGELEGDGDALQHRGDVEVLPHHPPLEAAFLHPAPRDVGEEQGVDQHGHQDQDDDGGHPATGVPDGHRPGWSPTACSLGPVVGPVESVMGRSLGVGGDRLAGGAVDHRGGDGP